MKLLRTLFTLLAISSTCIASEWKPGDIHPLVFQTMCCWASDTADPIVTEINLDATRANRNQFDYDAVEKESEWITYREDREILRYRISKSDDTGHSIIYQENGGGSFTIQRSIRFTIEPRTLDIDGKRTTVTVLRVHSIQTK